MALSTELRAKIATMQQNLNHYQAVLAMEENGPTSNPSTGLSANYNPNMQSANMLTQTPQTTAKPINRRAAAQKARWKKLKANTTNSGAIQAQA